MAKNLIERKSTASTGGASTGTKMMKKAAPLNNKKMAKVATPLKKGSAGKAPSMNTGNKSTVKKKIY